jgi:membrane protease YdiL (CAAX protease family)
MLFRRPRYCDTGGFILPPFVVIYRHYDKGAAAMTKWTIRKPAMYQNIPEGGFVPRAGVALLIALLLYIIYSIVAGIPTFVQAFAYLMPRVTSGQSPFDLINDMLADQSIVLVALFMTWLLILTTIIYIRRIEKRPVSTIGLSRGRIVRRYIAGFAVGVMLVGLTALPELLTEKLGWKGFTPIVAVYLAAFMIQGASEEVLFRGFLLSAMSRRIGVTWAAVLSSALFAVMHVVTIGGVLDVVQIFMVGLLLAMITVRTNSLWMACGVHSAWNFTIGLLFPVNAGGMQVDYSVVSVGDPNAAMPDFGFFGDPAGLIIIGIFAAVIAVVLLVGRKKLVVRRPESERVLARAQRIAKATLPADYLTYAQLVGAMVEPDDAKSAALLYLVMEQGVTPHALADAGIGREAGLAGMALVRRPGESDEARRERVMADPIAAQVWQAQEKYAADYAARQQAAEMAARQYAEWQAQQFAQWQAWQHAQWQARQMPQGQWQAPQAPYMSPAQAEWQARQDAERDAYVRNYAETTREKPDDDNSDGTLGY